MGEIERVELRLAAYSLLASSLRAGSGRSFRIGRALVGELPRAHFVACRRRASLRWEGEGGGEGNTQAAGIAARALLHLSTSDAPGGTELLSSSRLPPSLPCVRPLHPYLAPSPFFPPFSPPPHPPPHIISSLRLLAPSSAPRPYTSHLFPRLLPSSPPPPHPSPLSPLPSLLVPSCRGGVRRGSERSGGRDEWRGLGGKEESNGRGVRWGW